ESKAFAKKMEALDKKLQGSKVDIVGKKGDYTYQPILRQPKPNEEDDDDDDDKNKKKGKGKEKENEKEKRERVQSIKAKLDVDFTTGKVNTKVFHRVDGKTKKDKPQRKKVEVSTIDDVANAVPFRSKVRFILFAAKIWA